MRGETLLLWPGRSHGGTSPFAPDLKFYWVHFALPETPLSGSAFRELPEIPQHARVERPDHLSGMFQRLLNDQQIYGVQPLPDSLAILQMFRELKRSRVAATAVDGAPQQLAASAERWVRTHFHEAISASSVAARLGCSCRGPVDDRAGCRRMRIRRQRIFPQVVQEE